MLAQGTEFIDTVSLGPGLVISGQSIGVATSSGGFDGVDGILGYAFSVGCLAFARVSRRIAGYHSIGPPDLTIDTLSPDTGTTIQTGEHPLRAYNLLLDTY